MKTKSIVSEALTALRVLAPDNPKQARTLLTMWAHRREMTRAEAREAVRLLFCR